MKKLSFVDALYGQVKFDEAVSSLVASPILQRLRHVRLSNIDSLDMPGIANLTRYEHSLGVCFLASQVGFYTRLSYDDRLALSASALLHDWAITAFAHLVEEAFKYVGTGFNHETRLYEIIAGEDPSEIGGIERQIYRGRQTGLRVWGQKVASADRSDALLLAITRYIRGNGRFGRLICGDIDLDNIDNVFRMAYHMGLLEDRELPLRLAHSIEDVYGENGEPVFRRSAGRDIVQWLDTRHAVYERLMLAEADFAGKLMILYASVSAFEAGEIGKPDWNLTDHQLLERLLTSRVRAAKETVDRWLVGELWDTTPLYWMAGERPAFPAMRSFSKELSDGLSRSCFAYCIKDKRNRPLTIHFDDGKSETLGTSSSEWLLGVGSPMRRTFTAAECRKIIDLAQTYLSTSMISSASKPREGQLCFL